MCDSTGLAEAMLGLPGFRVLEVGDSANGELTVTVETMVEVAGLPALWVEGGGPGSDAGDVQGFGVFRSPGSAGVEQAQVVMPRRRL